MWLPLGYWLSTSECREWLCERLDFSACPWNSACLCPGCVASTVGATAVGLGCCSNYNWGVRGCWRSHSGRCQPESATSRMRDQRHRMHELHSSRGEANGTHLMPAASGFDHWTTGSSYFGARRLRASNSTSLLSFLDCSRTCCFRFFVCRLTRWMVRESLVSISSWIGFDCIIEMDYTAFCQGILPDFEKRKILAHCQTAPRSRPLKVQKYLSSVDRPQYPCMCTDAAIVATSEMKPWVPCRVE